LGSFKCSEIKICITDSKIRIFEDFIVFPLNDNTKFIGITSNSQELDAKAKEFYADRKDDLDEQFRFFVENRNISEVVVGRFEECNH
jgi:hypothetical protein